MHACVGGWLRAPLNLTETIGRSCRMIWQAARRPEARLLRRRCGGLLAALKACTPVALAQRPTGPAAVATGRVAASAIAAASHLAKQP